MMEIFRKKNTLDDASAQILINKQIENALASLPVGKDKKAHVFEHLEKAYGKSLAEQIISSLPKDFFQEIPIPNPVTPPVPLAATPSPTPIPENTNNLSEKQKTELYFKKAMADISARVESFPEAERDAKFKEILKNEYGVTQEKIKEFDASGKGFKWFMRGGQAVTILVASLLIYKDRKNENTNEEIKTPTQKEISVLIKKVIVKKPKIKLEIPKEKEMPPVNIRFDEKLYESLPAQGKDVYKYYAENDPTPGRGYMILDKDNAKEYIFDGENKLMTIMTVGFGKTPGDAQNTSNKYNEGNMTTPAGVYLLSKATVPEDILEYGKLQYSMFGISVLGNSEFIKEHQTYKGHGELGPRTLKLESLTPSDNPFSNGCINADSVEFKKNISPNFEGDYGELIFVLQDKKGRDSGIKFDVKWLTKQIAPMILEMADKEEKIFKQRANETRPIIQKTEDEKSRLEKRQVELNAEYQKDKSTKKEKEIEKIKKEIKEKIDALGEYRKVFNKADQKIGRIDTKRNAAKRILEKAI